jgi:CHAT domain-containing protein
MKYLRALCVVFLMIPTVAFAEEPSFTNVRDLMIAHRYNEARELLVQASKALATKGEPANEAAALLLLGMADSSLGDIEASRKDLEAAAAKCVAIDDYFAASLSLMSLAQTERNAGHLDDAIAVHERSLQLIRKAAAPESGFSLDATKALGPFFGFDPSMLGPIVAMPEIAKPLFLQMLEPLLHEAYAQTLIEADSLEKAEEQLKQASPPGSLFQQLVEPLLAADYGDLRQRQWRLDEARDDYVKALSGGQPSGWVGDPAKDHLSILYKLAELELLTGRVDEALAWNDRSMKLVRGLNQPRREAGILTDRADLLRRAARYEEANKLYEDVLKLPATIEDPSLQASIHAELGQLHYFQGSYGTAAKHLEKAIGLYQELNEPYLETPLWIFLAEVDLQTDMQDGADLAIENARQLAKKSGFVLAKKMVDMLASTKKLMAGEGTLDETERTIKAFLDTPDARDMGPALSLVEESLSLIPGHQPQNPPPTGGTHTQNPAVLALTPTVLRPLELTFKGVAQFKEGDLKAARASWQQALNGDPKSDLRAGILGLIGVSYWNEGRRDEGIDSFKKAASTIELTVGDVKVEEMLAGYLGGERRAYYDILIDMLAHEGHYEEAFAQAERARARAFLQMVGNHRFNAERGADPRLVREAEILRTDIASRERRVNQAHGEEATRLREDLERERQHYQTVLARVKLSNPEYESLTNIEPLKLEDVRAQLPPDTTLISYFVSPRLVHAWVIDRDETHYTLLPIDQDAMRRIVCWASSFGPPNPRGVQLLGSCNDAATAEDAFDRLFRPLLPGIHHQKLIIVPHGVLHYVPFAALHDRESGHDLIDDFTPTYAPSASVLRFLRQKESPVDGGVLVFGDPDTSLPKLPGARAEATAVARLFGATPHLGADAQAALLDDAHGKCDLIHIAAHGIYDPVNPLFSRIALADAPGRDGSLTVDQILSSLDLTGVNLVVLSACQSGIGTRSGGDEVVGLTRALLYAGTPGVISTLWNVNDAASAGLMEAFYRRLVAGASAADALRQAQLEVKAGKYKDPKYWAAYVLTGDPQGRWTIPP